MLSRIVTACTTWCVHTGAPRACQALDSSPRVCLCAGLQVETPTLLTLASGRTGT